MNKYYTPSIEEFHVGFECEIKIGDHWKNIKAIEDIEEMLIYGIPKPNNSRVKYLDKDDIESLGWELTPQYNDKHRKYWWEIGKLIKDSDEMWHPLGKWKYRLSLSVYMY